MKESSKLKEKELEQILNALMIKQEIKLILKARVTKNVNFIPNPVKVDFL